MHRYEPAQPTQEEKASAEESGDPSIPRLQPKLQLLASRTIPPARHMSVPLVRLQFRNGAFARVEGYVEPTRQLRLDSPITKSCVGLLRRVRETAVVLQQQWRAQSAKERQDQDVVRRSAVQQLVVMLPYSEAMVEAGDVHPFGIFTTLCAVAGHVASIASDPIPPNFARYNHYDMASSFEEVSAYIGKVLTENSSIDFTGAPFTLIDGGFVRIFEPGWKGRKLVLSMRIGDRQHSDVVAWAEHALIGATTLQDEMRETRVLGARRTHVDREPGLFSAPDTVLFRLQNDDFIHGGEMLEVLSGPSSQGSGQPIEMTLFVMHEGSTSTKK